MSHPDPVQVFRVEAAEILEQIEEDLLDLNDNLSDQRRIDAVFRGLHTLKGSGAMFGFEALAAFTHHCESAFDRVRKGEVAANSSLVAAILAARDHMKALIDQPDARDLAREEILLSQLHDALGETRPAVATPVASQVLLSASTGEHNLFDFHFRLPRSSLTNGTNPLALLDELRDLGTCTVEAVFSDLPDLVELDPTELHMSWNVRLETKADMSAIDDVFIFVRDDMDLDMRSPAEEAVEESLPTESPTAVTSDVSAIEPGRTLKADVAELPAQDTRQPKSAENVRVPAERLDELMDRVGELVIAQSRLSQLASRSNDIQLRSVSEDVERLSSELRDTMMVLRMVPIGSLFGRFRRLVHDLARETGKQVDFVMTGETTEVDKTVVERLADPLVHLIRNAIDHGLESAEERLALGKSMTGTVRLSARQSGGEVIITIRDDGRGIRRERVRAKAEAAGLLAPGTAIGDHDLLQFIFHPGFSTAETVTSLSGRGVGMDVVKKTVEGLRGLIDVRSEPGDGAEISLRFPLTLAIIDGLLVTVGGGSYVIPLAAVEECLELGPGDGRGSGDCSFILLRDRLIPFLKLRDMFNLNTEPGRHQKVVVVSTGEERVGLVVDQIIGDHQTVIKSMSKLHHDVATFSGATILGDGGVALILDVAHLVAAGQQAEARMRIAS